MPCGRLGSNTIRETKLGSLSCGVDVIPYFRASCSVVRTNSASTSCLACSPSFLAAFSLRPCERASARAAFAARSACAALAALCAWNWSWIWPTASLRNVPGPNTTLTGFVRASRAHGPFAPPRGAWPFGTLPERQPSRASTRSRSEVSVVSVSGWRIRT